jgi:hypothetical protein
MSVDPDKLRVAGADFSAGPAEVPPGADVRGLIQDSRVGRHTVRFLFLLDPAGDVPRFASVWDPPRPKRLKHAVLKQYQRARREFAAFVAQEFGVGVQVIDRSSGAPRVTELVYEDGDVERVDWPCVQKEVTH